MLKGSYGLELGASKGLGFELRVPLDILWYNIRLIYGIEYYIA